MAVEEQRDRTTPSVSSLLKDPTRYELALALAMRIEDLLEAHEEGSRPGAARPRDPYAGRIAQAMSRSLIDQLREIVRTQGS